MTPRPIITSKRSTRCWPCLNPRNVTADKKYGVRHQIIHVNVKRPDAVKTSAESAFFAEKHHTKIKKTLKASSTIKATKSMLDNTALLNTLTIRGQGQ
ncbi:hypothetical protein Plhal304r1_c016g0059921 [Plasmopara halstedii]